MSKSTCYWSTVPDPRRRLPARCRVSFTDAAQANSFAGENGVSLSYRWPVANILLKNLRVFGIRSPFRFAPPQWVLCHEYRQWRTCRLSTYSGPVGGDGKIDASVAVKRPVHLGQRTLRGRPTCTSDVTIRSSSSSSMLPHAATFVRY
jgi:hypothetical protein